MIYKHKGQGILSIKDIFTEAKIAGCAITLRHRRAAKVVELTVTSSRRQPARLFSSSFFLLRREK
jgi:hypothetical protein